MIDIVVPFYNDSDEQWKNIMYDYMAKEGSNDRQVVGEERYRDWENFKYWFRCVEQNCPWVNKVFLIVASETQIPQWLDTTNPKLRIVLHKEYIPQELLPTFNTMTIEIFISRIEDLSDNYIYCNDDYFFLNPVSSNLFFVDNLPVYKNVGKPLVKFNDEYLGGSDGTFYKTLNNNMDMQLKICGEKANWYSLDHLPVPHKKEFEKQIINEHYVEFVLAYSKSRFRHKDNYGNHLFVCLYRDLEPHYKFDYGNNCYVTIRNYTDFNEFKNYDMVCFNDTEQLSKDDFVDTKNRMIDFFESRYPNKSSFEK